VCTLVVIGRLPLFATMGMARSDAQPDLSHNDKMDDLDEIGARYLGHLTDADLRALVHADEVPAAEADARLLALRRVPELLLDVLDRPAVSAGLLNLASADSGERFTFISPFLVFAAAIHRIAADFRTAAYAPERASPRLRIPVFDGPQLAAYLAEPAHRLFLAELLASFARSSSGVIVTQTPQGLRRRRWNDLDLGRLAMLLDSLPEPDRPPVWRRLGDLALFLTGVFPAAIERALADRLDPARLARTTGLPVPPALGLGPAELFEWFGAGWYRLAASRTGAAPSATVTITALRDNAEHFHQARRVLNAAADRYLFPVSVDWFPPAA
jgi:hypothetical protein